MSDERRRADDSPTVFEEERRWRSLAERARRLGVEILDVFPLGVGPRDVVSPAAQDPRSRTSRAGRKRVEKLRESLLSGDVDWSPFFLEGPAGFREALPVLLEASLDEFPIHEDLMVGASLLLRPSCDRIARSGEDPTFRERLDVLTPRERAVVAAYLALLVEPRMGVSFLAAKALRWGGWTAYDDGAREALERFLEAVHHAPAPAPRSVPAASAVAAVREGFERTPAPPPAAVCEHVVEHGRDLGTEITMEFDGLDWRGLSADFLHYHAHALDVFTTDGLRYYLPAFLIADIIEPTAAYDPIGALAARATGEEENFTPPERRAIAAYLRYKTRDAAERERVTVLLRRFAVEE